MDQTMSQAFKKASIDWLLSVGQTSGRSWNTRQALVLLAEKGVDYGRSTEPTFDRIPVAEGDSFTDATYAEAVNAQIMPVGGDDWNDDITFFVSPKDWNSLVLGAIIRGVVTAGSHDEQQWRTRYTG